MATVTGVGRRVARWMAGLAAVACCMAGAALPAHAHDGPVPVPPPPPRGGEPPGGGGGGAFALIGRCALKNSSVSDMRVHSPRAGARADNWQR